MAGGSAQPHRIEFIMPLVFLGLPLILVVFSAFMVFKPRATLAFLQRFRSKPADPSTFDDRTINATLVTGMIMLGSGLIAFVGGVAATIVLKMGV